MGDDRHVAQIHGLYQKPSAGLEGPAVAGNIVSAPNGAMRDRLTRMPATAA
jgi:hypothetical protein